MSQVSPSHIRATAVCVATLRRLALSMLFTSATAVSRLPATRPLVPSPREPSIKGNTPMLDTSRLLTLHALRHNLLPCLSAHRSPEKATTAKLWYCIKQFISKVLIQIRWIKQWHTRCSLVGPIRGEHWTIAALSISGSLHEFCARYAAS